ncbi:DUF86 domain-containing protein [Paenibacillus sp. CAA11]|uniref:DUF86 domain-containing protein n=1 Tax=Paenibacillus sp. CAA11 TaxID=1532905 RepID=UPI000D36D8A7|nr:HepT-like ribonuclease domain-containing protein [Paenibacillus sp. CAA11]AWB44121.1 DUF86 domain-containing protein [Paenibacillus sp. CAA11]
MYYVNQEQIERRLNVLPMIAEALQRTEGGQVDSLERFARERALHLALEVVTDVGSYLIDGFIMRDASSYEDIVEIIHGERVIDEELFTVLIQLVRLRKPLVQDYYEEHDIYAQWMRQLPSSLADFAAQVREYLRQELSVS